MKMVKSLLLGSAAGLAALTGAQAADLPVKAKPVEYVKICSLYGAGFYYIPGTDTCIRIGGHIRSEVSVNSRGTGGQQWFTDGTGNNTHTRDRDIFYVRNRVFVNTDTRTQTSFGTLRTFSVTRFETNTGSGLASGANITAIDAGIIQWGGFTFGRAGTSYFDNPWAYAFKWGAAAGWSGNPDTAGGRFVYAYTHQFGNGISGTISLEDNKITNARGIYNGVNALSLIGATGATPAGGPALTNTQGGNTWPSVVGQLRIEQAWGGFHISGEVLNHHVAYNCGAVSGSAPGGCSELAGAPSDRVGGAVNAAFRFNLPTGVNDALYIGGTYSKGDGGTTWGGVAQGGVMGVYGGSGVPGLTYGSITGSYVWDSVYTSNLGATAGAGILILGPVNQQLTTGYGGSIAFEHGWNAEWRTSVFGGAQVVDYNSTANAILCSRFTGGAISATSGTLVNILGANVANTSACNWDYRLVSAGTRTFWTPVRDLTFGLELIWTNHHVRHADNTIYLQPLISGFKPNAAYDIRDQNIFSGMFSVRRFF